MATILKLRLCSLPLFPRCVEMFTQRGGDEPDRLLQVLWKFADINEALAVSQVFTLHHHFAGVYPQRVADDIPVPDGHIHSARQDVSEPAGTHAGARSNIIIRQRPFEDFIPDHLNCRINLMLNLV